MELSLIPRTHFPSLSSKDDSVHTAIFLSVRRSTNQYLHMIKVRSFRPINADLTTRLLHGLVAGVIVISLLGLATSHKVHFKLAPITTA